ncbi:isocitrate lyase/phosphoenolpyruvate mutase family protein [Dyadobacter sp. CY107]|uniref:isocitrate lyase/PEP mutase family protein n=1 Tax=Dyadobacter fanqingshengii TaxID=2906443 RepID=UPI001F45A961|nr:isocitrate lyase/phosphoenolpyruvate mutase family protein [Dyadobacter fanqingshengii]MCF2506933.1 isocitrate lyase/phosphoenolpyruvate mutase family protein [Dyadobacter fanqingshengii]
MNRKSTQSEKADLFKKLHYSKQMLVLPNIWDVTGAALLEETGYQAVATASAAIARANGFQDGEKIPFEQALNVITQIVNAVEVPVTADIESGYATDLQELKINVRKILATGVAGINIEDSDAKTNELLPVDLQVERIRLIRKVAEKAGVRLFINARTDVFLKPGSLTNDEKLKVAIERGCAYADAGADGIYPIFVQDEAAIAALVNEFVVPVNILITKGTPELEKLQKLGVARVSFGPNLQKAMLLAMKTSLKSMKEKFSHSLITDVLV